MIDKPKNNHQTDTTTRDSRYGLMHNLNNHDSMFDPGIGDDLSCCSFENYKLKERKNNALPRKVYGGTKLPTNDNLFDRSSLAELGKLICYNKPLSELFKKIGISNALFCSADIDLTKPIRHYNGYEMFKHPINRKTITRICVYG